MSESCCSTSGGPEKKAQASCPKCKKAGKSVQRLTVGALLKPDARKKMPKHESFRFCASPECDVVYFSAERNHFYQGDVNVRVGQKVTEEPKPVCYCFDYTEQTIVDDVLKNKGESKIHAEITEHVKAGRCFCEVTNPQGSCCLGNVSQAAKKGKATHRK